MIKPQVMIRNAYFHPKERAYYQVFMDLEEIRYDLESYKYSTIEDLDERMNIAENILNSHDTKINEIMKQIGKIKTKLNKNIIIKTIIDKDEDHKKFLEEQKKIDELKSKYEGEILAFTRKENKLKLVAHALFENDLTKLIFQAFKNNEINKDNKIFYR